MAMPACPACVRISEMDEERRCRGVGMGGFALGIVALRLPT